MYERENYNNMFGNMWLHVFGTLPFFGIIVSLLCPKGLVLDCRKDMFFMYTRKTRDVHPLFHFMLLWGNLSIFVTFFQ